MVKMNEMFRERISVYRNDPVVFAREILRFEPDSWQNDVLFDLAKYDKVTVRSGQGVGKTGVEAAALLWFLCCFNYARVVATAPTRQQLHDVLWAEVSKWQSRSPLLRHILRWSKTRVCMRSREERWFAVARTANKPENMQGFHEDNMLFIVDEASGVANSIMEAIQGTLSGGNNKLLMCGNPTKTSGTFFDSFHSDRERYRCHKVSSRDSSRTNKENIDFLVAKFGAESNVVRVRVDGEFPLAEDDVFISMEMLENSVRNGVSADTEPIIEGLSFGVDVARYGDDKTVIAVKEGSRVSVPVIKHGQDLMRTVGDIVRLYREALKKQPSYRGKVTINIDDTGLGGGVTDRLKEVMREEKLGQMDINPINFGSAVDDKNAAENYANIGTWLWAKLRDDLADTLSLPDDTELLTQLSSRKYTLNSRGKIILESKDTMKKRGIPSPDKADAVALACFVKYKARVTLGKSSLEKNSYWK
jgi:hypothetical protein